jgi:hypothetical protein
MAFGEMGLLPWDYYNMLPVDYKALVEGYQKKQYRLSSEKRYAAFIGISPHVKDMSYKKFCSQIWPLPMDQQQQDKKKLQTISVIDEDLWAALQKQAGKKTEYETILEKHKMVK